MLFIFILAVLFRLLNGQTITISASKTSVSMGQSLDITATVDGQHTNTLWPFLNGDQWGADQALQYVSSTGKSSTILRIPFPNSGSTTVQVAILSGNPGNQQFTVGQKMPSNAISKSNSITISVSQISDEENGYISRLNNPSNPSKCLMFFESWFTPSHHHWADGAEAIPLVGRYASNMTLPMKQHAMWFNNVGVNGIVFDWTNNLYGHTAWSQRDHIAQEMIDATTATLAYYQQMRNSKILNTTPQIVLLLGYANGSKNTSLTALEQEIDWITQNYFNKYKDLMFVHESKPLLIIWDGTNLHYKTGPPTNAGAYTIKWMTAHLNTNKAAADRGFFSWMDGSLTPRPTYVNNGTDTGPVEALTITTSYFGSQGGWLSPTQAMATNNWATLLDEGITAAKYSPQLLFVNQWNEFAMRSTNNDPNYAYLDIYNSTLGNDLEPTSLTQCGAQGAYKRPHDAYCGGWGFRALNILKAILYNVNVKTNSYFLGIFNPVPWSTYSKAYNGGVVQVKWVVLGKCSSSSMDIYVDNNKITTVSSGTTYNLNIKSFSNGYRTLRLTSPSCQMAIALSWDLLSSVSNVAASDEIQFFVQN